MLRMVAEAAALGYPAALGCYEHTAEELKYRLKMQAEAATAGAHGRADIEAVEKRLAESSEAVLLPLSDAEDTIRAIEETLTQDYGFPGRGPALLAVDYLQRVPVVGLTGLLLLNTVGIEIGRIVYKRGEVGKAADAAALAVESRIDVALYRETGEIRFLPDVYGTAQNYASMNSVFLRSRHIGRAVDRGSFSGWLMKLECQCQGSLVAYGRGLDVTSVPSK